MRGSSLVPLITADALRATIRAGELLREVRSPSRSLGGRLLTGSSLTRGLLRQSSAELFYVELLRLRGLGDLLAPVSTTLEIRERSQRLDMLFELLPARPSFVQCAKKYVEICSLNADSKVPLADLLSVPTHNFSDQLRSVLSTLQLEAAAWRSVEHSGLANRLIGDHGFANTYGQARKCARAVIKAQASSGKTIPKLGDLKALKRWNEAIEVQLSALAGAGTLRPELERVNHQFAGFGQRLSDWLALARLRRVPGVGEVLHGDFEAVLQNGAADLLVSLQQIYGPGKANFRALIVSELA